MTDLEPIDVRHLGRTNVICCWRVGDVIIDPGPSNSLETLFDALGEDRPRAVLATHIHLDHSGGIGSILRRWPETTVYVHERGAPHLADPSKLLASAERLYGDRMDDLWGAVEPVPQDRIVSLGGGETVEGFEVVYTPGHASHHVSYIHQDTGVAFVGDTGGVRIPPSGYVLAPTPPPDIDLSAWEASLQAIESRRPSALAITHFGRVDDPEHHLAALRVSLALNRKRAELHNVDRFIDLTLEDIVNAGAGELTEVIEQAAPLDHVYAGLERYLRKQAEIGA